MWNFWSQISSRDVSNEGYDLACIFDAKDDMGDPAGVAKAIREKLVLTGPLLQ